MSTETSNMSTTSTPPFKWQTVYMAYAIVMFFVLIIGFFGNVFTILVLRQREHRNKSITPLMINLAVADLFIIVFGYPAIIVSNLNGDLLYAGSPLCIWSGFANGVSGMTSIATLTMMSGVVYQIVKRNSPFSNTSRRQSTVLIVGSWLYGFITMFPPLAGWNRFVPGRARFSCAPEWAASDVTSKVYILWLMAIGYFTPLIIIAVFYFFTYRTLKRRPVTGSASIQTQRRKYQNKLIMMTATTIGAFLLSWSPYTFVSIVATIKGRHVMTSGEAEIPELLAKASVIYNPIVYTFTNDTFRQTLWGIVNGNRGNVVPVGHARNEVVTSRFGGSPSSATQDTKGPRTLPVLHR